VCNKHEKPCAQEKLKDRTEEEQPWIIERIGTAIGLLETHSQKSESILIHDTR
jgi:hypothetical protein